MKTKKKATVVISVAVFLIALISFGIALLSKSKEAESIAYYRSEYEECVQKKELATTGLCSIYQQLITETPQETQKYVNFGIYLLGIYFLGLIAYSSVNNKQHFFIGLALIVGFIAGILWLKRSIWTGFYYSDVNRIDDQRTWIISPPLYSLEECREWVNAVHREGDDYDYSCGQGCRFTTKYIGETMICRTDTD